MTKKILPIVILGGLLLALTVNGITLKDFFQKPLPSVNEFIEKVSVWASWVGEKIIYWSEKIFNWTIDQVLTETWKVIIWLWQLVKTGLINGWSLIDKIATGLATGTGIDWGNIRWPWE